jgi:hypothetical protein
MELDYLNDHFRQGPTLLSGRGHRVFHFYEPGLWLDVRPEGDGLAETTASWTISAASQDRLIEGIKRVWPCCDTLAQSYSFRAKRSVYERVCHVFGIA